MTLDSNCSRSVHHCHADRSSAARGTRHGLGNFVRSIRFRLLGSAVLRLVECPDWLATQLARVGCPVPDSDVWLGPQIAPL